MPITINGTGTVTGISAGGLPDGVITTDDIAAGAVTFGTIGTTEQRQLCRAWVNFNGTGTVAVQSGYNVSSVTDNGTGSYIVNFTTAMSDDKYCVVSVASNNGVTTNVSMPFNAGANKTSSLVRIETYTVGGSPTDVFEISAAVFR